MMHRSEEVEKAIITLADALCTWERATSIQSVMIIREVGGFQFRAVNGKPNVPSHVTDKELFELIRGGGA